MGLFDALSDAEARYKGINIKGWRRYLNKHTNTGKLGVGLCFYFATIGVLYHLASKGSKLAAAAKLAEEEQRQKEFHEEIRKWEALGRKFIVDDLRDL